ncbi:MAG TPA: multicopper oxidase domain-containing protein [Candidatus Dormibacteraeota bacterium]|nr:multicopper oxidase domain-containing protein [Candidatus Dormibacteraeota bacterium]
MKRRDLIKLAGAAAVDTAAASLLPARAQNAPPPGAVEIPKPGSAPTVGKADITLHIAPVTVALTPSHIISTIGYNGTSPGPILRMREGVPVTVDIFNETDTPEYVHWHGLHIPPEADGVEEEGSPAVPPHGSRRFQFTPRPAGTRWYHSHTMAMDDLHRSTYTGQFGFLMVDSGHDLGHYDREIFLALRDWEPFFTNQPMDTDEQGQTGPQPERPAVLDTRPNGLEVDSLIFSINDKVLGAGEPIRVRLGQRILAHILNASAIENRSIALPGHKFHVLALDGNPVPVPASVETLMLGPGERVDAIIEMNQPGVWILGGTVDMIRNSGLGVVIEYESQHREPQWVPPPLVPWDYTVFGRPGGAQPAPDHSIDMIFEKIPSGSGQFNAWLVNGKQYPHDREFVLQQGARYRIVFHNRTDDAHPLHMHRHTFELVDMNGKKTSGIMKDTVIVPFYGRAIVDLVANQPGLTLFHCHIQQHMDYGFKALFRYA